MFLFLVLLVVQTPPAASPSNAPRAIPRVDRNPVLDGSLSDSVWQHALRVADFSQRLPREGAEPTERTDVYLMHNATSLFIGVRAHDRDVNKLSATVMRRDDTEIVTNDQFAIAIDSYNDSRNGYWFSTNPLGVRVDAQFFDEGRLWESSWDGAWSSKARVDSVGWVAEIEIPFATLRFTEATVNTMGINMFRRLVRTDEILFAPLVPLRYLYGTTNVSIARKYVIEGIRPGNQLVLQPYVLGSAVHSVRADPSSTTRKADAGIDASYQPFGNLTLNASLNTDFAQAEADTRQINLTRFSLVLPEKRDFFLERAGTFSFGIPDDVDLFFSRRIGLATDSLGITSTVPISFGARATGMAGALEFGLLTVRARASAVVEAEQFGVARVKLGVGNRSYVGGILTRRGGGASQRAAVGLDYRRYFSQDIGVAAFVATTDSAGDGISRNRTAGNLSLFKSGEQTTFLGSITAVGADFAPPVGFVRRRGVWKWVGQLSVPFWFNSNTRLRRIIPEINVEYFDLQSGPIESSSHSVGARLEAKSNDRIGAHVSRNFELLTTPFPIFKNIVVAEGSHNWVDATVTFGTKPGRRGVVSGSVTAGEFWDGNRIAAAAEIGWKAGRHLTVGQSVRADAVKLPSGHFTARIWGTRASYSLNTSLSVEGVAQFDNATQTTGAQVRARYVYAEGTEVFLVVNSQFADDRLRRSLFSQRLSSNAIALKGTYALRF